jgi:hypothetical protein
MLVQGEKASMADSSNTMVLVKEAQAARVKAHLRAMVSRLVAPTQKAKNQTANFAELSVWNALAPTLPKTAVFREALP